MFQQDTFTLTGNFGRSVVLSAPAALALTEATNIFFATVAEDQDDDFDPSLAREYVGNRIDDLALADELTLS